MFLLANGHIYSLFRFLRGSIYLFARHVSITNKR
jgi:hypothetical protein